MDSPAATERLLSDVEENEPQERSILTKIWLNVIGVLLCRGDLVGDDAEQRAVPFKQLFRFATKREKLLIVTGCIFSGLGGVLQPAGIFISGLLTSILLKYDCLQRNDQFLRDLTPYLIAFVVCGIVGFAVTFLGSFLLLRGCNNMIRTLRREYLSSVLRQDAVWFTKNSSGAITSQLNSSIQKIEEGLGNKLGMLIRGFSMYGASFVVSLAVSWRLALICLISGPLAAWTLGIMGRVTAKYSIRSHTITTEAAAVVEEAVMNVKTVASCNAQEHMVNKYAEYLRRNLSNVLYFEFWSGFFEGVNLFVVYTVMGVNMWFGICWYFERVVTSPADALLVGNVMAMTSYQLGVLGPHMQAVLKARVAAASIYATIDQEAVAQADDGVTLDDVKGDIEISNVEFGYPGRETVPILRGISWTARSGTAVALVGNSGSGKSTSIGLLTRLYDPLSGLITIDGVPIGELNKRSLRQMIGLVEQEPCLFNGSILENIVLGRKHVTEEAAREAAVVAEADGFIRLLKDGYETRLGVGGVALSGGQKQRIAIARAIATDPKILLLDEATSALDTESERVVQASLNRAAEGRTTIIVAHRLSTLKDVDRIFVVEKGVVVEEGTHDGLIAEGGVYAQLARAQEIQVAGAVTPDSTQWPSKRAGTTSNSYRMNSNRGSSREESKDDGEGKQTRARPSCFGLGLLYSNLTGNWRKFLLVILLAFLRSFEMILVVVGNSIGFDSLSPENRSNYRLYAGLSVAVLVGCGVLQLIFEPLLHLFSGWTAEIVVGRLRIRALQSLLYRPMESFDRKEQSSAACVATIAKYSQPCVGAFNFNFGYNISNVFAIVIAVAGSFIYSWEIGTLTAVFCLVLLLILLVNQTFGDRAHFAKATNDRTAELSIEVIEQARTIQLLTVEEFFLERYAAEQAATLVYDTRIIAIESFHFAVSQMFSLIGDFSSWLLLSRLAYAGTHQAGALFRAVNYTSVALWSILYSAPYIPNFVKAGSAAKQLFTVIDDEATIVEAIEEGERPDIEGQVRLEAVDFAYSSRPEILVSRQLSLSVEKGRSIALVGASGCGKSSIINLLERFYSPTNGLVLVDGHNICRMNLQHLRSRIALVSQEPVLFKGTILENITMGAGEVPLSRVVDACRTANAVDFIESFPDGYETDVGERGKTLSGGQKQRIAIARALVRDPKILLLDEATSALDTESEEAVQTAINDATVGRTSITIAHRLSSIQNCDQIFVIERGTVVESGSHKKLLRLDGRYAKLVAAQMLNA